VKTAPYGSWASPITAPLLVEQAVGLGQTGASGADVYWNEARPSEGGRMVVVRRAADGHTTDVFPPGFSARTIVHEYGGASYTVRGDTVWFANFADQRVYKAEPGTEPAPVTPEPPAPMAFRFADFGLTPDGRWVVSVRERHGDGEAVNDVVAFPADGGEPVTMVDGHDFFSAPRISPDGRQLAWLSWDHPNMPWDGTDLWVADVHDDMTLGPARHVAGGRAESISQPRFRPDGRLLFVSDRTGWWNLYVDDGDGGSALSPRDAEFSGPDWVFGLSSFVGLGDGTLVAVWSSAGFDHLGYLAPDGEPGELIEIDGAYTAIDGLVPLEGAVLAIAGSPVQGPAVVRIAIPSGDVEILKRSRDRSIEPGYLSVPTAIDFPTEQGHTAHALFYAPANQDFVAPADERPPLMVLSHGGPTSATSAVLNLGVQFWTSRGFAVVDVDYGGSTGYGRDYRDRLRGDWGIVDVDDCVNAAQWLAEQGKVDPDRMVIRGGSAGGYTTLAALAFRDVFAAGASHFGVADASALARDTHKFESRYLDGLIGPWPEAEATYIERSPIHHTDGLDCPIILFQGLEDRVVPPDQAETMADALRAKGIPFAHLAFEGEQHGFRKAGTIIRVAEAELSFYGQVFGFEPADEMEPVVIENADALDR
jgi:dipeptidyl aminopeptidase/acylaminoacyl peptidase